MFIINRYLAKDLGQTFLSVFFVLLLIATSNKLVSLIAKVSVGEMAQGLLLKIVMFQLPHLCSFLLPFSLFLAIILSFGRAIVDNELPVLLSCGLNWSKFVSLGLLFSCPVILITALLNFGVVPYFNYQAEKMLATQEPGLLADSLIKGRFYSFNHDKLIFYVNDISPNKRILSQVFIVQQTKKPAKSPTGPAPWAIITAEKGEIKLNNKDGYAYLELTNGTRYEGMPGKQDYNIIHFGEYRRLIEKKNPPQGLYHARSTPTSALIHSDNKSYIAELQWRFAIPLSAPILVLLAVPLSWVAPRSGRYGRLLPAIVLYFIYYNGLEIAKRWVADDVIPSELGLWSVHLVIFLLALTMNAFVSGRAHQFFAWVRGLKHDQ